MYLLTIRHCFVDKRYMRSMAKLHKKTQEISSFILSNVLNFPSDIAAKTASHFGMTRQGVNRHLKRLEDEGFIQSKGVTRNKSYRLVEQDIFEKIYNVDNKLSEGTVWKTDISGLFEGLPSNVLDIWHYGFTEMFNNVIDHSNSKMVSVVVQKTSESFIISIVDNGVGIFKKIQKSMSLADERHSVLELAKGKFTTDPDNHTGEGIFFSSRIFDNFRIISGKVHFSHNFDSEIDWIHENPKNMTGTSVLMKLNNNAKQDIGTLFDDFTSSDDDHGFTQTVVPVELAQYGDDRLVSRSQAKRLLVRIDRFKTVILDFEGVDMVGQAFADEIFRVFQKRHPDIQLMYSNANKKVENMIKRALTQEN